MYRAFDQHGPVIEVYVSRPSLSARRPFFTTALTAHGDPVEVVTARAPVLANVIEDLIPAAVRSTEQYQPNRVEADHGRLKPG